MEKTNKAKDFIDEIVPIEPFRIISKKGFQLVDPVTLEPVDYVDVKRILKLKE
jgi:hypothetical protein